jgi:hypothetical protein
MSSNLAEHLRALPDDGLGAFLRLRPDLVVPVPTDIGALAARAQSRVSVVRTLDSLDQFTLEILDGLRLVRGDDGETASLDALLALTAEAGVAASEVRSAVNRLKARFLVFGPDHELQIVKVVDELTSPFPAGLGRPAAELSVEVADVCSDPAGLRRRLLSAPPEARAILDRLAAGPPVGTVTQVALKAVDSPIWWLMHQCLLVQIANDLVELPREVAEVLRRDSGPLGPLHPQPPALDGPVRPGADSAGAGQALDAVRQLDALLTVLADAPAPVLRSFGLGVRELRRLAKETGISEQTAALLLEIAYASGLLTYTETAPRSADLHWLPAPAYDTWRAASLANRWALLARTWLRMSRAPAMVGQRDEKDRPISALSPEASRLSAPASRQAALMVLADLADGTAPGTDAVIDHLAWQTPRRMNRSGSTTGPAGLARAALAEAALIGFTGLDAMTSYGRVALAAPPRDPDADPLGIRSPGQAADDLVASLAALLPAPVDHVLIQADLTVVVPGPPEAGLASELALVADTESRGGATVYRVTPHSVRRALDAGFTAADVHELFRRRSRTALPQTLEYLVDDVARRHGGLRVGSAGAYIRGDDEALISEAFTDRRLASMSLRRLAPTVLASPHNPGRLLEALREAGYAPVPEDATGTAVLTRPKSPRGPVRPLPNGRTDDFDPPLLTGPLLAGVVEQIRLGDRLARATRRSPLNRALVDSDGSPLTSSQAHTQALSVLQQAMRDQARVWVGYVDAHGGAASKLVRPVSMGAGYLRAEDDRTQMLHTFALHRITSAMPED